MARTIGKIEPRQDVETIRTTLGAVARAEQSLSSLLGIGRPSTLKLAPKAAYHIAKLYRLVEQEAKHFHDQRNALLGQLGRERDARPDEIAAGSPARVSDIPAESVETFRTEAEKIAAVEVVIPWRPATLAMFGETAIAPADLFALEGFIEDADDDTPANG